MGVNVYGNKVSAASLCFGILYLAILSFHTVSTVDLQNGFDTGFESKLFLLLMSSYHFPVIEALNISVILNFFQSSKETNLSEPSKERNCSVTSRCIRKCCEEGKVIDLSTNNCRRFDLSFELPNYIPGNYALSYGMECPGEKLSKNISSIRNEMENIVFKVEDSIKDNEKIIPYHLNNFCLENFVENGALKFLGAQLCVTKENVTISRAAEEGSVMYNIFIKILTKLEDFIKWLSNCFLLATFIWYAMMPELRNMQGKSIMCYVASLITNYSFSKLSDWQGNNTVNIVCKITVTKSSFSFLLRIIATYTYLATFFWLNAMSVDVWRTFRSKFMKKNEDQSTASNTFKIYSLYAWGCPAIIVTPQILKDIQESDNATADVNCAIHTHRDSWPNLKQSYCLIGILLLLNSFLYARTAYNIFIINRSLSFRNETNQNPGSRAKKELVVYLKLLVITGATWFLQLIAEIINNHWIRSNWLTFIIGFCEAFQSILIFYVTVSSKKAKILLASKLKDLCSRMSEIQQSTQSQSLAMTPLIPPCGDTSPSVHSGDDSPLAKASKNKCNGKENQKKCLLSPVGMHNERYIDEEYDETELKE